MHTNERKILNVVWGLVALLTILCSLAFYVSAWSKAFGSLLSFGIIMAYLGLPILVLERFGQDLRSYNLYAHRMETLFDFILAPRRKTPSKPDIDAIQNELLSFIFISTLILVPYTVCFFGYFWLEALWQDKTLHFALTLPPDFSQIALTQIFVVALPEEFFWRGFVQSTLLKKWPNERYFCGLPLGRAVVTTNLLFALAHFVLGFAPARLLTFFPGLIFSALVMREKSLLSAILFHALCNIFAIVMYKSLSLI